ncbi:uncharacterized protein LOC124806568 [Hydra vulgaris]|uniref:uncharacterized protein LOC124806568 n=1 Tax=Hydra vulgaris TaxID=6087 RepID=UPI001F5E49EB|nr:uncharacterized protein LOC124806568 [Hydra vulgaris]
MKKELKLEDILYDIENGLEFLSHTIKKDNVYTVIIGPTGAGKSTIANVLNKHKVEISLIDGKKVYDVVGESTIKIGHKNVSTTKRPNIENSYIDCPGLGDTEPAKELQNAVYMQKVFSCEKFRVIIVTESSSIFDGRAQVFIKMLENLNDCMGKQFVKYSKQFGLCISKVSLDDFELGVTDDPSEFSKIIKQQVALSTYQDLVESLQDRIMCFTKNDSYESITRKLMNFIPKVVAGNAVPISPILSPAGILTITSMIEDVFNKINDYNNKNVGKYIKNIRNNLKTSEIINMTEYINKLNKHVGSKRAELFKIGIESIENSSGMNDLVTNIIVFNENIKHQTLITTLSIDGLKPIRSIACMFLKSNDFSDFYKQKFTDIIKPVMKLEEKYENFLKDINTMEKDWNILKDFTTSSNWKKIFALGVGIASAGVLAADSIPSLELSISKATKLTASIFTGCSLILGGLTSSHEVIESCDTFEKNHPEIKPYANEFRQIYKGLPNTFAELWIDSRPTDMGNYLQTLRYELKTAHIDNFSSQYNDIS